MTSKITGTGSLYLKEQAAALAEVGASGQVWVDDATPNTLMFTNDAGTDQTVHTTTTLPSSQYQQVAGTVVSNYLLEQLKILQVFPQV